MKVVAENLLQRAVRQYRHNAGSEDFLFAYDKEETEKVVEFLLNLIVAITAK